MAKKTSLSPTGITLRGSNLRVVVSVALNERPVGMHEEKVYRIIKREIVPMERVGKLCILEPDVRRVRESTRRCRNW